MWENKMNISKAKEEGNTELLHFGISSAEIKAL